MSNTPKFSRDSIEKAQEINQKIRQWWNNRDNSELSAEEISQLIQELSSPQAVWYLLPEETPYNSMEAWCEGELGCQADFFLETVESVAGETAVNSLQDRRLSAIFRPFS